jgi:hypothetical protein
MEFFALANKLKFKCVTMLHVCINRNRKVTKCKAYFKNIFKNSIILPLSCTWHEEVRTVTVEEGGFPVPALPRSLLFHPPLYSFDSRKEQIHFISRLTMKQGPREGVGEVGDTRSGEASSSISHFKIVLIFPDHNHQTKSFSHDEENGYINAILYIA